jgi:hypothetical protein
VNRVQPYRGQASLLQGHLQQPPAFVFRQIKPSVSATICLQRLNCAFAMLNVALPKVSRNPGFAL